MSTVSSSSPATESTAPDGPRRSLKNQLISSSLWTILGYGASQVLRFGNNLVLTRLLSTDVFGVMALVQAIIAGLNYVTDVGIGPSVIQSKMGEDPRFLGTAWTIQILRNSVIWVGCCLLALPAVWLYREPQMAFALPVAGLATLLTGFVSINLFVMNKKLHLGPQTLLDLGTQFLAIVVMIILAYNMRSLWALLIGTIVGALARAVISHWVLPGPRIRLGIDRELAAGMFHFGRWITISTMITFVLSQGDRLILGRYMTKTELGVYAIGFLIPQTATTLIGAVTSRVLFPLYSRLVAEGGGQLRPRVRKVSPILLAILLPPLWLLMLFSQHIIDFLYDPRYHGAGWILRLFAASASVDAVTSSVGPVLLAMGNSLAVLKINIAKILGMAVLVALGGWLGGTPGLIVGFAAVPVLSYPVIAWFARRSGTWFLRLDAAALVASALILAVGWKLGL